MPLIVPHCGELQLLTDVLSGGENWLLCLFGPKDPPTETDTAADYLPVECSFDGYERKLLYRSVTPQTWNPPISQEPSGIPPWSSRLFVGHTEYGDKPQTWVCGKTCKHGETVYGYFMIGEKSRTLIFAEAFQTPRVLREGSTLGLKPIFENA